jgi:hypothetical protein
MTAMSGAMTLAMARRARPVAVRSPAREALRLAVAALAKAERNERSTRDGLGRAEERILEAVEKNDAAVAALRKASDRDATDAANAARAGDPAPPASASRRARALLAEAEDLVLAARAGRDSLQAALPGLQAAAEMAKQRVEQAVSAVIKSELAIAPLMQQVEELTRALSIPRMKLRLAQRDGLLDAEQEVEAKRLLRTELPPLFGDAEYQRWREHPLAVLWQRTREALMQSADAPVLGCGVE